MLGPIVSLAVSWKWTFYSKNSANDGDKINLTNKKLGKGVMEKNGKVFGSN